MNQIQNITLSGAWDEVTMIRDMQAVAIQARTAVDIQMDWVPGAHATFWTIKSGTVKSIAWRTPHTPRLFLKGTAGVVVEVETATMP